LFRTAFRTSPGFILDRVSSVPEDALAFSGKTASGVEVEFARPLAAGQRVELRFEFRGPALARQAVRLGIPQFVAVGATERDGWISFTPGPAWSLVPMPQPGAVEATDFDWPE